MNRRFAFPSLLLFLMGIPTFHSDQAGTSAASSLSTLPGKTEHVAWGSQAVIYEVNLRQYSAQGNFAGFEKSLPRLRQMGVDILWFMPITPIGLIDRKDKATDLGSYYAVKDYYSVNPDYGTMDDWRKLVRKAQNLGFKVILDWVPNHSAPDNPWIKTHPDFYEKDSSGHPKIPYDWSDTRQLNYANPELRDSMMAAMEFWVNTTHIDGFRCDVAWHVPDDFWKQAIARLWKIKPVFMLAEGDLPSLNEDGFDATYAWNVMNVAYGIQSGKNTLHQLDSVINVNDSLFPKNSYRMYFTTNHDENSFNGTEFERFGEGYKAFAVWTFTMGKSIPLIYSGQEEPNRKRLKFFIKDSIQWGRYQLGPFYKALSSLRHSTPALSADAAYYKLDSKVNESVFAYQRQKNGRKITVILNLSNKPQQFSIDDSKINGRAKNVFADKEELLTRKTIFHLKPWDWLVYDYPSN
jgi:alpha-amylase